MQTYDNIADMFERIAAAHERVAAALKKHNDPVHNESNEVLADAEAAHAAACKRAARALRGRAISAKRPPPIANGGLRKTS